MARKEEVSVDQFVAVVTDGPHKLVGPTEASRRLGIQHPNLKRYRERLTSIPIEGLKPVFLLAEVEALAAEIAQAREARAGGGDD